ncbi:MAG: hypothetical protein AAF747_04675, partial [Planctomycetota bacterium]
RTAAIRRVADILEEVLCVVECVPRRFGNLATSAEIDDVIIASPGSTLYSRERSRLISDIQFRVLVESESVELYIQNYKRDIHAKFEVDYVANPAPHAFCLGRLGPYWPHEEVTHSIITEA